MSDKPSYRKPYSPDMPANWWQKLAFYRYYILRESTAIFMIWFSMLLLYGVTSLHTNEFYRFIFFLRSPIVIGINVLTLLAALLHTVTWFNLAPKAANVVVRERKLPGIVAITLLWSVTIAVSVVLLVLVLG